jgi:hypothetical protein
VSRGRESARARERETTREKETRGLTRKDSGDLAAMGNDESSSEAPQLAEDLDAGAKEMPRVPPVAVRLLKIEP